MLVISIILLFVIVIYVLLKFRYKVSLDISYKRDMLIIWYYKYTKGKKERAYITIKLRK